MKTFDPKIFNGVRVLRAYELATGRLQPDEIHDITMDGQMYNMGYKVVTEDMKSLGLRNNPNILEYKINEWKFLPIKDTKSGKEDFGGIWVARLPSGASSLKKYMKKKHDKETRIFKATLGAILYYNSYRVKTTGVRLFEEIF